MTTLAANLSDSATQMRVNAADANPAPYYQIDSEVVQLLANVTVVQEPLLSPRRRDDTTLWQIDRAMSGTTAAAHLSGATLTPVYDPSVGGGGGGLDVTDGTTTVAAVTTLELPSGTVTDEGGGVVGVAFNVMKATVVLTDAQIKALPTTKVEIVPAPGVGKNIVPVMSYSILDAIAGVYTNIDGSAHYTQSFTDAGVLHSTAFVVHSANFLGDNDANRPKITLLPYAPSDPDASYEYGYSENKAISASVFNAAAGNLTGGNAANTLTVTVIYGVMDI